MWLCTMPDVAFYALWCVLLLLLSLMANLGELRLWGLVLIRTVFGTIAVLVAFVVSLANFRNYLGVVIGTCY